MNTVLDDLSSSLSNSAQAGLSAVLGDFADAIGSVKFPADAGLTGMRGVLTGLASSITASTATQIAELGTPLTNVKFPTTVELTGIQDVFTNITPSATQIAELGTTLADTVGSIKFPTDAGLTGMRGVLTDLASSITASTATQIAELGTSITKVLSEHSFDARASWNYQAAQNAFDSLSLDLNIASAIGYATRPSDVDSPAEDEFLSVIDDGWAAASEEHELSSSISDHPDSPGEDVVQLCDSNGRLLRTHAAIIAVVVGATAWTSDLLLNNDPSPVAALSIATGVYIWLRQSRNAEG